MARSLGERSARADTPLPAKTFSSSELVAAAWRSRLHRAETILSPSPRHACELHWQSTQIGVLSEQVYL